MPVTTRVLRDFGHPRDRRKGWDFMEIESDSREDLQTYIAAAERKFWKVWVQRGHEGLSAQLYKPSGALAPWRDAPAFGQRVIVYGPAWVQESAPVRAALQASEFQPSAIVIGRSTGTQRQAACVARDMGIPLVEWQAFDDASLIKPFEQRNEEMVRFGDALVVLWDGEHAPTRALIDAAKQHGLPVHVERIFTGLELSQDHLAPAYGATGARF